jgi:Tol biopolymer transport system component
VYDAVGGSTTRVTRAEYGVLSADGMSVVVATKRPLVAADDNGVFDIYLIDRETRAVRRVLDGTSYSPRPRLWVAGVSGDARLVSFYNFHGEDYVLDVTEGTVRPVPGSGALSTDGSTIAYTGDMDGDYDEHVFIYDVDADTSARITDLRREIGYLDITADGNTVVNDMLQSPELYFHGHSPGTTHSFRPRGGLFRTWQLSDDGNVLVHEDFNSVFHRTDLATGSSHRLIRIPDGVGRIVMSEDGSTIAFAAGINSKQRYSYGDVYLWRSPA